MTVTIKECTGQDLETLEELSKARGWDHILHMVRNEQQVRVE